MKNIKYSILILLGFILCSSKIFAQAAWIEPDPTDVTKPIKIYADLSKTTNKSLDGNPGPFYIWTWLPVSGSLNSAALPKVNRVSYSLFLMFSVAFLTSSSSITALSLISFLPITISFILLRRAINSALIRYGFNSPQLAA